MNLAIGCFFCTPECLDKLSGLGGWFVLALNQAFAHNTLISSTKDG